MFLLLLPKLLYNNNTSYIRPSGTWILRSFGAVFAGLNLSGTCEPRVLGRPPLLQTRGMFNRYFFKPVFLPLPLPLLSGTPGTRTPIIHISLLYCFVSSGKCQVTFQFTNSLLLGSSPRPKLPTTLLTSFTVFVLQPQDLYSIVVFKNFSSPLTSHFVPLLLLTSLCLCALSQLSFLETITSNSLAIHKPPFLRSTLLENCCVPLVASCFLVVCVCDDVCASDDAVSLPGPAGRDPPLWGRVRMPARETRPAAPVRGRPGVAVPRSSASRGPPQQTR